MNKLYSLVVKVLLLQVVMAIVASLAGWGNVLGVDVFAMMLILASLVMTNHAERRR